MEVIQTEGRVTCNVYQCGEPSALTIAVPSNHNAQTITCLCRDHAATLYDQLEDVGHSIDIRKNARMIARKRDEALGRLQAEVATMRATLRSIANSGGAEYMTASAMRQEARTTLSSIGD